MISIKEAYYNVKSNSLNKKWDIEMISEFAEKINIKLLSSNYLSNKKSLHWQCNNGHTIKRSLDTMRAAKILCTQCSDKYVSENICRAYFEYIYDKKFPKYRSAWLKSKANKSLEIDGYCEELGLAFEHHGEYHYKNIKFFNQNKSLYSIIENDLLKQKLCIAHGVKLIIIPQLFSITKIEDLYNLIVKSTSIPVKHGPPINCYDLIPTKQDILNKYLKLAMITAEANGGKCLSTNYIRAKNKMTWVCNDGHMWEATYEHVVNNNTWCRTCVKQIKLNVTKTDLIKLHFDENMSLINIADKFNVCYYVIKRYFDKFGIVYRNKKKDINFYDYDELYNLYRVKNFTICKISKIYKVDWKSMKNILIKLNLLEGIK